MIINGTEVKRIFRNFSTIRKIFRNGIEVYTPPLIPIARYSAKGRTNQDADRTILKDLEGNGHDIVLRNFGYSLMSGFGGFNIDFTIYATVADRITLSVFNSSKIIITSLKIENFPIIYPINQQAQKVIKEHKIKISGLNSNAPEIKFSYVKTVNGVQKRLDFNFSNGDGEYTLPESEGVPASMQTWGWAGFYSNIIKSGLNITIEQIPLYPDCLVSDGVDDCGICSNLNVGKDYTVILKREFINRESQSYPTVLSKRHGGVSDGEFAIDGSNIALGTLATSYGLGTAVTQYNQMSVSVQTKNQYWSSVDYVKYNLQVGTATPNNTLVLCAGILQINGQCNYYFKGAISDLIIYDRTLTEEEALSEINKYGLIHESPHILTEMGGGMATENNNLIILE